MDVFGQDRAFSVTGMAYFQETQTLMAERLPFELQVWHT